MPGPRSRTTTSVRVTAISTGEPAGLYLHRVVDEVRDRSLELRGLPEDRLAVGRQSSRSPRDPIDESLASRRRSPGRRARPAPAPRPSSCRSRARPARRRARTARRPRAAARRAPRRAGPRASDRRGRSTSMLVRRLVSGVRISWLASVMSLCCWARDVANASTMVVKLRARLPTSPSPSAGIGVVRSCVLAICSAVSRSFTTGRTMRRASHQPRAAAAATPASASRRSGCASCRARR